MDLNLDDPSEVALAASGAFDRVGLQAALYGGLALAVYGARFGVHYAIGST